MEKLVPLSIISLSPSNLGSNSFILLMRSDEDPTVVFPIIIGPNEAQAISVFLENIEMPRPLTHQLFINVLEKADLKIDKILIKDFKDGIFYSLITFDGQNGPIEIDARPSDGIALAIKMGKPIYIQQKLLNQISINSEENDLSEEPNEIEGAESEQSSINSDDEVSRLNLKLKDALEREDYETAAKIRDQINSLTNK